MHNKIYLKSKHRPPVNVLSLTRGDWHIISDLTLSTQFSYVETPSLSRANQWSASIKQQITQILCKGWGHCKQAVDNKPVGKKQLTERVVYWHQLRKDLNVFITVHFLVYKQIEVQLMHTNLFCYKVPPICFDQRRPSSGCIVTEYQFSCVWPFGYKSRGTVSSNVGWNFSWCLPFPPGKFRIGHDRPFP